MSKNYITVSDLEAKNYNLSQNCIRYIFNDCSMFEDANMKVTTLEADGTETEHIYNIGVNAQDLADIFAIKYEHRIIERPIDITNPNADVDRIKRRLHAMVCEYIPKYLKIAESYGYKYNPLANVDADEQYASIDNVSDATNTGSHSSHSSTNVDTTSTSIAGGTGINAPETSLYETQYDDTGKQDANLKSYTTTSGGSTSHSTASKDNNYSDATGTDSTSSSYTRQNVNVKATDNALGFAWDKATNVHIEKHRRVGNIGVTKTTELIESERATYRSIIEEFLKDASREILLPLYNFN